jgi:hypothetical protein
MARQGATVNEQRIAVIALLGLAAVGALYFAVNATPNTQSVPQFQTEAQFAGMNVKAGINLGPLMDTSHLWDPAGNPRDANPPCGVVATRHRYPCVPGGNISTVMHKGWSAMSDWAPAGNDWYFNPPEAAVL